MEHPLRAAKRKASEIPSNNGATEPTGHGEAIGLTGNGGAIQPTTGHGEALKLNFNCVAITPIGKTAATYSASEPELELGDPFVRAITPCGAPEEGAHNCKHQMHRLVANLFLNYLQTFR